MVFSNPYTWGNVEETWIVASKPLYMTKKTNDEDVPVGESRSWQREIQRCTMVQSDIVVWSLWQMAYEFLWVTIVCRRNRQSSFTSLDKFAISFDAVRSAEKLSMSKILQLQCPTMLTTGWPRSTCSATSDEWVIWQWWLFKNSSSTCRAIGLTSVHVMRTSSMWPLRWVGLMTCWTRPWLLSSWLNLNVFVSSLTSRWKLISP